MIPGIKKITFWARELRLPLFWLPQIMGKDSLLFYKNSVIHLYHLNNKEAKAAQTGYRYFIKQENVVRYESHARKMLDDIGKISDEYKKLKLNKLSDNELRRRFFNTVKKLVAYSDLYTKTEEIYLVRLESDSGKYEKLIKTLGDLRFDLRKGGEPLFYVLLGIFLREIAKRFGIKAKDLFFYRYTEMEDLFNGRKVKEQIIKQRQKGYALIRLKNKTELITGDEFNKLFKEVVISPPASNILSGNVVMKGKARGSVRLILHNKKNILKEVAKFKDGEILVTEMTRPDTILACRKAAAIITDEGGITSHAAIVARELKIPCIVGTKNATQILKTGYLVELDTDTGTIKIL